MIKYSDEQESIFKWIETGNGNAVVIARAGSGKTFTALHGMKKMKGNVISMTFNKKNQVELDEKIKEMGLTNCKAATFHAEGLANFRNHVGRLQVNNSKVYYIVSNKNLSKEESKCTQFILKMVSLAKQCGFGLEGCYSIDSNEGWIELYKHHDVSFDADIEFEHALDICKEVLKESNQDTRLLDFEDMLYLPMIYDVPIKQYDWVIVDEAQDTNIVRKMIAEKMLKPTSRFLAIGDDKQAIYGFTGAENDSMNIIKNTFNCVELKLSTCYRCDTSIIEEAQSIVPDILARPDAGEGIVNTLHYDEFSSKLVDYNFSDNDGIICRNNAPIVSLAFKLIRKGIGCRIEGRDIGKTLINLCKKWKRVTDLDDYIVKLTQYFDKEFEKASRVKMLALEDKMNCMIVLIERAKEIGMTTTWELSKLIDSMFSDYGERGLPKVVTLSSIHKAKGLEWKRCFNYGNSDFIPSKYAVQDWQQEQEENLRYVAVTRAMNELVHVTNVPTRSNGDSDA